MTTIVALESRNVKRIKAVHIEPDGSLVIIGGRNAQGKSSVLDSISFVFGGKRALPPKPLRDGEDYGKTTIKLSSGLVATRSYTEDGGGQIRVENEEGMLYKSPQRILDALLGEMFDPLAFDGMKATDRLALLAKIVGVDLNVLDGRRRKHYDERTGVGRSIKEHEGALALLPAIVPELPETEISISELATQAEEVARGAQTIRSNVADLKRQQAEAADAITHATAAITDLRNEIEDSKHSISVNEDRIAEREEKIKGLREAIPAAEALIEKGQKDVLAANEKHADLSEAVKKSEGRNTQIRANAERRAKAAVLEEKRKEHGDLTKKIAAIDVEKVKALETADFPIEGLSFGEDDVFYQGHPWEQASLAERIRVSVAMGFVINPELRVLLVRDGSVLDEEHLALVAQLAEENEGQLWIERVGDKDPAAIIIEDGMVRGAADAQDAPEEPAPADGGGEETSEDAPGAASGEGPSEDDLESRGDSPPES